MQRCDSCGVVVEDQHSRCPLCGRALNGSRPETCSEDEPQGEQWAQTVSRARFWLWQMISLLAASSAVIVFSADFAFGFELTWSRYPLLSIAFLWLSATLLIRFARRPLAMLPAQTAALLLFLYALDRSLETAWFLPLALPTVLLLAGLTAGVAVVARRLHLEVLSVVALATLGSGVLAVGFEIVFRNHLGASMVPTWSLVVIACTLSLFWLILFIKRQLKLHYSEFRKIFHL
ncbi:MAG: hypothetical protein EA384_14780 [Spirochaetaceae bacterium]|nr:MAG: hypothetical protein EA384_14780 [Spirochaetaceae bacterium]